MAVKRSGGLGRGLDALFSDSSIAEEVAAEIDNRRQVQMILLGMV